LLENTVLVVRDEELLTPDTLLKKNDSIKIISVVSGG
jgi:molybdopterin converting factor small subunit